jgi:uncharacterized protein YbaR (Trm112 family)
MVNKKLLSILCCPITHKGLSLARADLLASINSAINAGELINRDGNLLDASLK